MVVCNVVSRVVVVLLVTSCFLICCGKANSPTTDEISKESKIVIDSSKAGVPEQGNELLPGEFEPSRVANGETSQKDGEIKASVETKSVVNETVSEMKSKEKKGDELGTQDDKMTAKETNLKEEEKKDVNEQEKQEDVKKEDKTADMKEEETGKQDENTQEKKIDLKSLNDHDFEHLTQASSGATTGDWLILFSKKDCNECSQAEQNMQIVYERVKHQLNVAKVEEGRSSKLTFKRFSIENLPVVLLFHQGKKISFEHNKTVEEFMKFLEGGYQMAPWSGVRDPYTYFEYYVDEAVDELKHMIRYRKNVCLIIFLAGFVCGISLTSFCGSVLFHLLENFKDEEESESELRESRADLASKSKSE